MLWRGIDELAEEFGDRLVFIGGVAVYLHVSHVDSPEGFIEFSHDGDFFISLSDFSALRDIEDVTLNRRLAKHQIVKHGVEFDMYVERNSRLRVPYEEALQASSVIEASAIGRGIRVASPEHLLVLKLDAYGDRRGTNKGDKDERDLIRIAYVMRGDVKRDLLQPYLTEDLTSLLVDMKKSHEFLGMSGRNAHRARMLREMFSSVVDSVVDEQEAP